MNRHVAPGECASLKSFLKNSISSKEDYSFIKGKRKKAVSEKEREDVEETNKIDNAS